MAGAPGESPTQPGHGWPLPGQAADWPGRPTVDVPGLEQPAKFCSAGFTFDEPGHRAILVLASEDGTMPTLDQLGALADYLDELHGEDAPEGSRAWLSRRLHETEHTLRGAEVTAEGVRRRAETAETALRDRADVDAPGLRIEQLTLELAHTRQAHAAQAARAAQLYEERRELAAALDDARAAAAELQLSAPLTVLRREVEEQTSRAEHAEAAAHRLRRELGVTRQESDEARADADRYANALVTLEQERDEARATVLQLGPPAAALREETERLRREVAALQAHLDHSIEARVALLDSWRAEASVARHQRQEATQAARRRSTVSGLVGLFTGLVAALTAAWRHHR